MNGHYQQRALPPTPHFPVKVDPPKAPPCPREMYAGIYEIIPAEQGMPTSQKPPPPRRSPNTRLSSASSTASTDSYEDATSCGRTASVKHHHQQRSCDAGSEPYAHMTPQSPIMRAGGPTSQPSAVHQNRPFSYAAHIPQSPKLRQRQQSEPAYNSVGNSQAEFHNNTVPNTDYEYTRNIRSHNGDVTPPPNIDYVNYSDCRPVSSPAAAYNINTSPVQTQHYARPPPSSHPSPPHYVGQGQGIQSPKLQRRFNQQEVPSEHVREGFQPVCPSSPVLSRNMNNNQAVPGSALTHRVGEVDKVPPPPNFPAPPPPLPVQDRYLGAIIAPARSVSPPLPPPPPELNVPSEIPYGMSGIKGGNSGAPVPVQVVEPTVRNGNSSRLPIDMQQAQADDSQGLAAQMGQVKLRKQEQIEKPFRSSPDRDTELEVGAFPAKLRPTPGKFRDILYQNDVQEPEVPASVAPVQSPSAVVSPADQGTGKSVEIISQPEVDRKPKRKAAVEGMKGKHILSLYPIQVPGMEEIDLDDIDLSQVPGYTPITDRIPNWKRDMIERKNKERLEEYVHDLVIAQQEAKKWEKVPPWKRKLMEEKFHKERQEELEKRQSQRSPEPKPVKAMPVSPKPAKHAPVSPKPVRAIPPSPREDPGFIIPSPKTLKTTASDGQQQHTSKEVVNEHKITEHKKPPPPPAAHAEPEGDEDDPDFAGLPAWKIEFLKKRGGAAPKNWGDDREEINEELDEDDPELDVQSAPSISTAQLQLST